MNTYKLNKKIEELFIEDKALSNKYIIHRLQEQRKRLNDLINDLEKSQIIEDFKWINLKNNIRTIYNEIEESIESFFNGNFEKSSYIIFDRFLDPKSKKRINGLKVETIKANNITNLGSSPLAIEGFESTIGLYRVRSNNSYALYEKEEMFHIPFEKRGLVSNQRYSISGYPCLYIGNSIYGCWEATGRPNIDTFNVVSLKAQKNICLIDLRIPTLTDLKYLNEEFIYQLILPLACSLKTKNSKDPFKPEYIIPQNVLSGIIKRNVTATASKSDIYWDGIVYTANIYRQKECLFNDKDKLINIVIPIKSSEEQGLCKNLLDSFVMSSPTSVLTRRLTDNVVDAMVAFDNPYKSTYEKTMWGELEESIESSVHSEIDSH